MTSWLQVCSHPIAVGASRSLTRNESLNANDVPTPPCRTHRYALCAEITREYFVLFCWLYAHSSVRFWTRFRSGSTPPAYVVGGLYHGFPFLGLGKDQVCVRASTASWSKKRWSSSLKRAPITNDFQTKSSSHQPQVCRPFKKSSLHHWLQRTFVEPKSDKTACDDLSVTSCSDETC